MDLASATLCLYLVFPVLYESQAKYAEVLNRSMDSDPLMVEKKLELESFLAGGEDVAVCVEPESEIALDFEDGQDVESDADEEKEQPEFYYACGSSLPMFDYGEEKFAGFAISDSERYHTSVNKDCIVRRKYDGEFNLLEELVFSNSSSFSGIKLVSRKTLRYGNDRIFVEYANDGEKKFFRSELNFFNQPVKERVYKYVKNPESSETNPLPDFRVLSKVSLYSYDSDNRIVKKIEKFYDDKTDEKTKKIRARLSYKALHEYSYTSRSREPDYRYSEDGRVCLTREYYEENSYVETAYFDNEKKLVTDYRNGIRVLDDGRKRNEK